MLDEARLNAARGTRKPARTAAGLPGDPSLLPANVYNHKARAFYQRYGVPADRRRL